MRYAVYVFDEKCRWLSMGISLSSRTQLWDGISRPCLPCPMTLLFTFGVLHAANAREST